MYKGAKQNFQKFPLCHLNSDIWQIKGSSEYVRGKQNILFSEERNEREMKNQNVT